MSRDEYEREHLRVLQSFTEIYNTMHVIDLEKNLFYEYKSQDYVDVHLNQHTQNAVSGMKAVMTARVNQELLSEVLEFSDLTTLGERLKNKQFISMEFMGREKQWMRATFIVVERGGDGCATKVIFTTQNIHENKSYVQELLKKTNIDEFTGFYNRRAYENDKYDIEQIGNMEHMVLFMFDINGLKKVNDTWGHQAGDELILASCRCMEEVFSEYGRIYRIGGDEFVCLAYLKDVSAEELNSRFQQLLCLYRGDYAEKASVSSGYVREKELQEPNFKEMERIADTRLYEAKSKYYKAKESTE